MIQAAWAVAAVETAVAAVVVKPKLKSKFKKALV